MAENLKEIEKIVLSYTKLKARVRKKEDKESVRKYLKEIKGDFNPKVVNRISSFLDFTFARLYDGLNFETDGNIDLDKLRKENTVILVPNHQSHADYIALTYTLWNRYKFPIYVAGGINLNIFPIGYFFRNSGCFFIRRSFGRDILYKLTFEAYIYYLMKKGYPIEFFFEGGRSRTGKLLPPRFGMFSMILEAHKLHCEDIGKPLLFVPISLSHEFVPETKAHQKELTGGKKKAENFSGILKAFKLFGLKMGSVYIRAGKPIAAGEYEDIRDKAHEMAFDCYRSVGKNMMITPTALISMIMLDEPKGALTWQQIYDQANNIIDYCENFNVPTSEKLKDAALLKTLKRALNLLVENRKVTIIKNEKLKKDYYSINEANRSELLYFKNTIIHHFLVPYMISAAGVGIFNGQIKNFQSLKKFLMAQREQLKYEFYLPKVKNLNRKALEIISYALGRKISTLQEAMECSKEELFKIVSATSSFSTVFNYIFEAYYTSLVTLRHFGGEEFNQDKFLKASKEIFELEISHGRFIRYQESYAHPILKNSLKYFESLGVVSKKEGLFKTSDMAKVEKIMDQYAHHLLNMMTLNLKVSTVD